MASCDNTNIITNTPPWRQPSGGSGGGEDREPVKKVGHDLASTHVHIVGLLVRHFLLRGLLEF